MPDVVEQNSDRHQVQTLPRDQPISLPFDPCASPKLHSGNGSCCAARCWPLVRRVSGEKWMKYLRRLAQAEGMENPTDEDLRRFDRKRKGKKVSNVKWASPIDPDARIMKTKDGRTRFTYKAEHAVDLDSDLAVTAEI